jgi:metallo-beta-lactamase family protein
VKLTFLGATGTVTGSRFLIEHQGARLLIDCGLFQGPKSLRSKNWQQFPVDPASLDAVVLTHAHIDHSGYLPRLAREGFAGPVWATPATKSLCELMLPDSARLQEEEAYYANKKRSSSHDPALPLYTTGDAERVLEQFVTAHFGEPFTPVEGLTVHFSRVGHILGAAAVRVSDGSTSVVFTGDVGRPNDVVMREPDPLPTADYIVTEATYGDRVHPDEDSEEVLADLIRSTIDRGGSVLIPTFAVGRAQMLMHLLARLRAAGRIPVVPTFLNSPMATSATEIMVAHESDHRLTPDECSQLMEGVEFVRTVEESKELTDRDDPVIVLSASGMATGGRVLHHLMKMTPDARNTVIFVGHQAAGTRGWRYISGEKRVRIYGQDYAVNARIAHLDALSAHADAAQLTDWLAQSPAPKRVFIVHAEPDAATAFTGRLQSQLGWSVEIPALGDSVDLT